MAAAARHDGESHDRLGCGRVAAEEFEVGAESCAARRYKLPACIWTGCWQWIAFRFGGTSWQLVPTGECRGNDYVPLHLQHRSAAADLPKSRSGGARADLAGAIVVGGEGPALAQILSLPKRRIRAARN